MRLHPGIPLALVALAGCREESPEAAIRKAFDACVEAIQDADPGGAAEVLSPGFAGPDGMTRDEARLYLAGILRREKVGVTVLASRVEAKGSRGTQSVEVLLTSRTGGALLPGEASRKLFVLQWERLEGHWRLKSLAETR
ncbi:MAG TPA: hypothetical protein PKM35_03825 [Holophaga sp.]|nr:hypothetical protein [Holophaga sp.]HPS68286.1 hypothetical protein [Holophaga sp.]